MTRYSRKDQEKRAATRFGNALLWVFLIGVLLATCGGQMEGAASTLPGTPLTWEKVSIEQTTREVNRVQVDLVIVPTEDQTDATPDDLMATAMQAALKYHAQTGADIVSVRMICQKAANASGELYLAVAVYIPDSKGYTGNQSIGPWDRRMTAQRGYTALEKDYLRLWAELRDQFQNNGTTDDVALDAEVSRCLMVEPGSVIPQANFVQNYE